MVEELDLTDQDASAITEMSDIEIMTYIPDWAARELSSNIRNEAVMSDYCSTEGQIDYSPAFRWRLVARTIFSENLPADVELPGVDVFSYKLSDYLSDDGSAASTLYAIKEAYLFAESWIPFCREYDVKTRCPEAFFPSLEMMNAF
ncbi:hypothetical protein ACET3Z_028272 [Daucus carota]